MKFVRIFFKHTPLQLRQRVLHSPNPLSKNGHLSYDKTLDIDRAASFAGNEGGPGTRCLEGNHEGRPGNGGKLPCVVLRDSQQEGGEEAGVE